MSVEDLIMEEIAKLSEELDGLKAGTDEYKAVADRLDKLMSKAIEMGKINIDAEMNEKQMIEERQDRWIRNGISIGGIVLPIAVTIWGTLKSLKFEESGTVTTIMGRGFINKLLPKK